MEYVEMMATFVHDFLQILGLLCGQYMLRDFFISVWFSKWWVVQTGSFSSKTREFFSGSKSNS